MEFHQHDGFRAPQVCSLVGISYRQLDYWTRTGLITPSITTARGSGSQRRYSYVDVVELKVIKQLLDAGLSLPSARKAVSCLRDIALDELGSANLVIAATGSVVVRTGDELIDLLRGGQGVLSLVPMEGVVRELSSAIAELPLRGALGAPDASSVASGEKGGLGDGDAGAMHAVEASHPVEPTENGAETA